MNKTILFAGMHFNALPLRYLSAVALASMSLGGCALFSKTPGAAAEMSFDAGGGSVTVLPSGEAQVDLGWGSGRGVFVPTVTTDANGNQTALLITDACGEKNMLPVSGNSSDGASAAVTATTGTGKLAGSPNIGGQIAEGAAFGMSSILDKLIQLQTAANQANANGGAGGTQIDVLKDYRTCPQQPQTPTH
jgi:hypothetical protein